MSWRVPDDNWESPWSFEDEWLRPTAAEIRRIHATPGTLEDEAPASAPKMSSGIRRGDDIVLRFEDDHEAPSPAPPAREKEPVTLPPRREPEKPKSKSKPEIAAPLSDPPTAATGTSAAATLMSAILAPALALKTAKAASAPATASASVAVPPPAVKPAPVAKAPDPLAAPPRPVPAPAPVPLPSVADDTRYRPPVAEPPKPAPSTPPKSEAPAPAIGLPPALPTKREEPRPYTLEPLPNLKIPTAPPAMDDEAEEDEAKPEPSVVPARRLRRPSAFSWGSLISLGMGTLGFTLLAWIYLYDEPRDSDEDLRPQVAVDQTPITQGPEKLKAFLGSIRPVDSVVLRRQPPWLWDTPTLSAFVRSNGTAFDNLRDLLEDYDWHPHHAAWHREDLSSHPAWPHAACLLQAQAAYLARRGDEEPALIAAMDLAELSRRLQDVWAWPGYMHQALELQFASVKLLADLLKSTHLSSAALARFQEEFSVCQPDDNLMKQACGAYYLHEKKLLLGPASGELLDTMPGGQLHQRPGRLFFKMNETLGLFASAFRDLRDEVSRPPYTLLSVNAAPARSARLGTPRFYHPNSNGEAYFRSRIDPQLGLPEDHSLAKARHGLIRSLFAVRRYLADKSSLPVQLQSLVPTYLESVPQDPFSGDALYYEKATGLIYSVGVNLIAEGGRKTRIPLDDDREPTVEIGIAQAQAVKP